MIGSDNGSEPRRRQAIIATNDGQEYTIMRHSCYNRIALYQMYEIILKKNKLYIHIQIQFESAEL